MKNEKLDSRPIIAAIIASIIILIFGLTNRILQARLSDPVSNVPIDPSALEKIPMQIGRWTGITTSLDDEIASRTNADALITRQYSHGGTSESVSLYIACGIRTSEIMAHHPMVCYPGNGWTLVDRSAIELPVQNGMKLPCNIFQFSRGSLEKQRVTVLHFLIVDGSYLRDISLARTSLWRITSRVNYVAQVHIVSSSRGIQTTDSAKRIVSEFAVDSAPSIAELFERIENNRNAETTDPLKKEGGSQ